MVYVVRHDLLRNKNLHNASVRIKGIVGKCMTCNYYFLVLYLKVMNVQSNSMCIYPDDTLFAFMPRFWDSWWGCREVDDPRTGCTVHRRKEGGSRMSITIHCELIFTSSRHYSVTSDESPACEHLFVSFFIQIKTIPSDG